MNMIYNLPEENELVVSLCPVIQKQLDTINPDMN
jgi:hypothetical protein